MSLLQSRHKMSQAWKRVLAVWAGCMLKVLILQKKVHFPQAGSFRCSETELGFEVRAAVTLRYNYESWRCCQTELDMQQWMIAGPLFNIWAEPAGAVAALHLPHFMCLAVMPFHAVLENPRFSFWGAILKIGISMLSSPIHGITLLYRALRAENITLHLYLIPDILPLRKTWFTSLM
uniref:FIIND domain-containing protein n=1 Tax=Chrysemys picta bellii TaxID=8478 RepID=A0A8C3HHB7_CHRPI